MGFSTIYDHGTAKERLCKVRYPHAWGEMGHSVAYGKISPLCPPTYFDLWSQRAELETAFEPPRWVSLAAGLRSLHVLFFNGVVYNFCKISAIEVGLNLTRMAEANYPEIVQTLILVNGIVIYI